MSRKKTLEEFVTEYTENYGDYYDFSNSKYNGAHVRMEVGCPKHGLFNITPHELLKGQGCKQCGIERRAEKRKLKLTDFISRSSKIHNGKYRYDLVKLEDYKKPVKIICPTHGEFEETPRDHLQGYGCKKCALEYVAELFSDTKEEFVNKAKIIHENKYDYSLFEYKGSKFDGDIICPKHGVFPQKPCHHLQGSGCPKCGNVSSHFEDEIVECFEDIEVEQRNRKILDGKEIDIYIPSHNSGIEFNGLYWHSEANGKDENYHLNKLNECNKNGVELIQIFEDEWVNKRKICEALLKNTFDLNINPSITQVDCEIHTNTIKTEIEKFLNENDINPYNEYEVAITAHYKNEIAGVITLSEQSNGEWLINNFTTNIEYDCDGIEKMLFNYFITNYGFSKIMFFADRRWVINVNNNTYTLLGFNVDSFTQPSFSYYKLHSSKLERLDQHKITGDSEYTKVWDCGYVKYIYIKEAQLNKIK